MVLGSDERHWKFKLLFLITRQLGGASEVSLLSPRIYGKSWFLFADMLRKATKLNFKLLSALHCAELRTDSFGTIQFNGRFSLRMVRYTFLSVKECSLETLFKNFFSHPCDGKGEKIATVILVAQYKVIVQKQRALRIQCAR